MRNTLLAIAALVAFSTPAFAETNSATAAVELGAGAVTGTVVGIGVHEGWFGSTAFAGATSAAGAATVGGVVGVGTVALIDATIQPCRGFQALLGLNKGACNNGTFVGYAPPPRRVLR